MANNILFINASPRKQSRTKKLADCVLGRLDGTVNEERVYEYIFPQATDFFLNSRNAAAANKDFSNPLFRYAKTFAEADIIVIAAPFWDMSFPAALKSYIEQINVVGITFSYTPEGKVKGLCKAKALIYITSAGGNVGKDGHVFGYGYVKWLAKSLYGIENVMLVNAEGLDIVGVDTEAIMKKAEAEAVRKTDELIQKAGL